MISSGVLLVILSTLELLIIMTGHHRQAQRGAGGNASAAKLSAECAPMLVPLGIRRLKLMRLHIEHKGGSGADSTQDQ